MPSPFETPAKLLRERERQEDSALRSSSQPPLASVIIPTYRDWTRCFECLDALREQTLDAAVFEIIVVNNDPADLCPDTGRLAQNVTIIDEEAPGSYAARNAGVAASSGTLLAFTDSDCRPRPKWLEAAVETIRAHNGSVRVTGPIEIFRTSDCGELAYLYDRKFAFNQSSATRFEHAVTANLVVSRAIFESVGLFNASMMSGGDFEWDARAAKLGISLVFNKEAVVRHPSRRSVAELSTKARRVAGGSVALGNVGVVQMIWSRLKPPVNKFRALDRHDMTSTETTKLFLLVWWLRIVAAREFVAIKLNLKEPERI
ncbi:glycosyltransferase family 2 protein [Croceibacterium ferulae]|uniref:glycosyltransferase family 2 protein n=1 Tax=Croceibacterium ferulae TaxID=1854641 RepID=UPI000EB51B39|nr:glycosyltransferase family A protein [Croceibacterium ferulae]